MMKSFKRIFLVGFLIYNFGFNAQSLAQDRPLKKINWGMTALSAAMWIPWLAKEAKIYEKNGLDVEIDFAARFGADIASALGGSLFAAPVALPQVMYANLNGADLVNVAHTIAWRAANCWFDRRSDGRKTYAAKGSRPRVSARWAIFCFATRCASTA